MKSLGRREFLKLAGVCAGAVMAGGFRVEGVEDRRGEDTAPYLDRRSSGGRGLRTITYNVLKCHGFAPEAEKAAPRFENGETARRIATELSRYEPDIITFQEGPPESLLSEMARQLGMQHCFFPGGWHGGIITRFEIVRFENRPGAQAPPAKDLFTRHWGRAVLKTASEEIALYSAHLHPSDNAVRAREVTEALEVMQPVLGENQSVIFQGDLNHPPDGPEYPRWIKAGLKDSFAVKGRGQAETFNSHKPYKRIDYIWTHGPLAARLQECRVLFEGAFRTDPAEKEPFALSDHLPVLAVFSS